MRTSCNADWVRIKSSCIEFESNKEMQSELLVYLTSIAHGGMMGVHHW